MLHPIAADLKARDPLAHAKRGRGTDSLIAIAFIVAAIAVHGAVIATAFMAGTAFARREKPPELEAIEVEMVDQPPPEEPKIEPPPEEAKEPEPEQPKPKKEQPLPDPIDVKPEPPPPEKEPPRRIVGLSLESTTDGSGGQSFAVGNTRMGKTEKIAHSPVEIETLPKPVEKVLPTNREATRVPTKTKSVLVKPKPIGGMREPPFPDLYQAQGIEADVTVRVRIDRAGKAIEAEVVSPAPQPEFNRAAIETAQQQKFEPASRDGQTIEWTITFTYHFRLVD